MLNAKWRYGQEKKHNKHEVAKTIVSSTDILAVW